MIDKEILVYLRLAHGSFNTIVFFFVIYQGSLGYRIRKARLAGGHAGKINKKHRQNGPVLVALGIAGFFAGMLLAYLDYGHILKYPLHFINGAAISAALVGLFLISKKIKAADVHWRKAHFALGIVTVFLYCLQILLGLNILL
jgi:hypothetical protein